MAEGVLGMLTATSPAPLQRAPELGDPFPSGYDFVNVSPAEVERTFGESFAHAVFRLESGVWSGPVESSYGQHLVRVVDKSGSFLPGLEDVSDDVRRDMIAQRRTRGSDAYYEQARGKYTVTVDDSALIPNPPN